MTGRFLETLYDVLFQPQTAMRRLAAARPVRQALVTFLLSALVPALGMYVDVRTMGLANIILIIVPLQILGSVLLWFISAAVLHLLAELSGGHGSAVGLFTTLGFAHLPRIFITPLWVLASLLPDSIRLVFFAIFFTGVIVWTLTLDVWAIRGTYNCGSAKAVAILAAPLLTLLVGISLAATYIRAVLRSWPFS
jgi:hypothetical protein